MYFRNAFAKQSWLVSRLFFMFSLAAGEEGVVTLLPTVIASFPQLPPRLHEPLDMMGLSAARHPEPAFVSPTAPYTLSEVRGAQYGEGQADRARRAAADGVRANRTVPRTGVAPLVGNAGAAASPVRRGVDRVTCPWKLGSKPTPIWKRDRKLELSKLKANSPAGRVRGHAPQTPQKPRPAR